MKQSRLAMFPTFTIIIPHKNCPNLLNRCLDSIPQREDIQIIVVDDNSDECKKPVVSRKDVEVVLLDAENSKGAGRARNAGLEKARGKWLLFADSDDFFVDNFMELLDLHNNSFSDVIMFKADSVDSETLVRSNRNLRLNKNIDDCMSNRITPIEMSLSVQQPWCRMIRTELVKKNMILFDEVIASNDTMFTTKVSCMAKSISVCSDIVYVVTDREGSLWNTRKKPDNYLCRINISINRALYLRRRGLYFGPLIFVFLNLGYVVLKTNITALYLIAKNGLLFSDLLHFFYRRIKMNLLH